MLLALSASFKHVVHQLGQGVAGRVLGKGREGALCFAAEILSYRVGVSVTDEFWIISTARFR